MVNEETGDECESECSNDIFDNHNEMPTNEVNFSVFIVREVAAAYNNQQQTEIKPETPITDEGDDSEINNSNKQ